MRASNRGQLLETQEVKTLKGLHLNFAFDSPTCRRSSRVARWQWPWSASDASTCSSASVERQILRQGRTTTSSLLVSAVMFGQGMDVPWFGVQFLVWQRRWWQVDNHATLTRKCSRSTSRAETAVGSCTHPDARSSTVLTIDLETRDSCWFVHTS